MVCIEYITTRLFVGNKTHVLDDEFNELVSRLGFIGKYRVDSNCTLSFGKLTDNTSMIQFTHRLYYKQHANREPSTEYKCLGSNSILKESLLWIVGR